MKLHRTFRRFAGAVAVVSLVVGTVCLGLGLSAVGYINDEHARGHVVLSDTVHECVRLFVIGVLLCVAGLVLRVFR